MSLPRYSSYKKSATHWLGDVPEHWTIQKFRHIFKESSEKIDDEVVGVMLSVSGYRGIEIKEYDDDNRRRLDSELVGYRIVRAGQLVVNTMWLNYAGLGVSEHEGHVSPAYRSYEIAPHLNKRFVHHMMRSESFVQGYTMFLTGIRPNSLQMSREDLMSFQLVCPPMDEQTAIAKFVDRETAKIDGLISEQEKLITLLAEKRQATISLAVSKGVSPGVPMKDPGVELLGEMPDHWSTARVRQVSTFITSGPRGWSDFIDESGQDIFLQSGDLNYELQILPDQAKRVKPPEGAEGVRTRLKTGDVVVCITGANTGRVAVVDALPAATYINQHLSLIRPITSKILPEYMALVLASSIGQTYFSVRQYGLKEGLSLKNVADAPLPLPSVSEQEHIVKFVQQAILKIESLDTVAKRGIALLKERRSALISAAVTGKIDVRRVVLQDQSIIQEAA